MTENNESTTMEDQHVVIDLDSVELLSTRPSIGAARAEYIVRRREQGNLNLANLAHTTRLSEPELPELDGEEFNKASTIDIALNGYR